MDITLKPRTSTSLSDAHTQVAVSYLVMLGSIACALGYLPSRGSSS